ncbi:hypothetical protein ACN9TE_05435 [Lactococcus lactis]
MYEVEIVAKGPDGFPYTQSFITLDQSILFWELWIAEVDKSVFHSIFGYSDTQRIGRLFDPDWEFIDLVIRGRRVEKFFKNGFDVWEEIFKERMKELTKASKEFEKNRL